MTTRRKADGNMRRLRTTKHALAPHRRRRRHTQPTGPTHDTTRSSSDSTFSLTLPRAAAVTTASTTAATSGHGTCGVIGRRRQRRRRRRRLRSRPPGGGDGRDVDCRGRTQERVVSGRTGGYRRASRAIKRPQRPTSRRRSTRAHQSWTVVVTRHASRAATRPKCR